VSARFAGQLVEVLSTFLLTMLGFANVVLLADELGLALGLSLPRGLTLAEPAGQRLVRSARSWRWRPARSWPRSWPCWWQWRTEVSSPLVPESYCDRSPTANSLAEGGPPRVVVVLVAL